MGPLSGFLQPKRGNIGQMIVHILRIQYSINGSLRSNVVRFEGPPFALHRVMKLNLLGRVVS